MQGLTHVLLVEKIQPLTTTRHVRYVLFAEDVRNTIHFRITHCIFGIYGSGKLDFEGAGIIKAIYVPTEIAYQITGTAPF